MSCIVFNIPRSIVDSFYVDFFIFRIHKSFKSVERNFLKPNPSFSMELCTVLIALGVVVVVLKIWHWIQSRSTVPDVSSRYVLVTGMLYV